MAVASVGATIELVNSILWDNDAGAPRPTPALATLTEAVATVAYSDLQGGCTPRFGLACGDGILDADPDFADDALHLAAGSPCIDAVQSTVDIDGFSPIVDGNGDEESRVDLGARERPGGQP